MTKSKAISMMREQARNVVEFQFASKLTQAFGKSISKLGFKPRKYRLTNGLADIYTEKPGVAIRDVAQKLTMSLQKNLIIDSRLIKAGFGAEDIVKKATAVLEAMVLEKKIKFHFTAKSDGSFVAKKNLTPKEAESFSKKHNLNYRPVVNKG